MRSLDRDRLDRRSSNSGRKEYRWRRNDHGNRSRHSGSWSLDAVKRRVERFQAELACLFWTRLHVGFVDLHDVGARCEKVLDLRVNGGGVVKRAFLLTLVEIVLRLLRHGERARDCDLYHAICVGAQKSDIIGLDRILAADLPGDARNRIGVTGAIECGTRIVDVYPLKSCCKTIGVAFATHLAVGDNVEPGPFLIMDRTSVASFCARLRDSGGIRQSSVVRTEEESARQFLRSISQSGWATAECTVAKDSTSRAGARSVTWN